MQINKIVITGGHHTSAIALIDYIKNKKNNTEIIWIGRKYISLSSQINPEYKEVTRRNVKFYNMHAGKLYRFKNPLYIVYTLLYLFLIPIGFVESIIILLRERPNIIVSFGGYIALPVVIAGALLGIPSVTHEQTTVIGISNSAISNFVKKIFVSWPISTYGNNKFKNKMVFTGLPLRQDIFDKHYKKIFQNRNKTILFTGGKLGSEFINNLVLNYASDLLHQFNIIWQTGGRVSEIQNSKKLMKALPSKIRGNLYIKDYFQGDDWANAIHNADFVVSRSGGHVVYECIALQKPAIFIPISNASRNEQYKNAMVAKKLGVANILTEDETTKLNFYDYVLNFAKQTSKMKLKESTHKDFLKGQEKLYNEIFESN